jgi:asparagine synthase (glutamine-hydrolysing)
MELAMCGICGFVGNGGTRLVEAMTALMAHRGPDGEGIKCFSEECGIPPAGLGHRRLSIIDPHPRGAQPMSFEQDRYWITYNGELYNYRDLRHELEARGCRFRTATDTEVLLAMYAEHGPKMLDRLNGIFAFAIWDAQTGSLFMARDRLGVKPLYWARHKASLYFASEAKALFPALPVPRLRAELLAQYLTFLWVPDPDTLFDGIYKLPPGHCATFRDGRLSIEPYWDVAFEVEDRSEAEWSALVGDAVRDAVKRQMVADVPVGSFLSGGIDSSAIVASMRGVSEDITTYTIGFSSEDLAHEIVPDDLRYSREVALAFGVDYHEEILKPSVVELLPKLVWHMDEPVADPACISTYLICAAARSELKVVLSGMGGDEIFAGYPRHLAAQIGRLADLIPTAARAGLRTGLEGRLTLGRPGRLRGPRRNLMKLLRGIDQSPLDRYLTYCSYYRGNELGRLLLDHGESDDGVFAAHRQYAARMSDVHWLNQLLYIDLKTFLPCLNLAYTDKMSMAASTEVRVPLLDDQVVALAGRIPPELKLRGLTRKYIFKRSMERTLPKEVVWRPKAGFGAPVRAWMAGELREMIGDLLSPASVRARGLFDVAEVQRLIAANESGHEDNALRLWALLTLEIWQQEFLDNRRTAAVTAGGQS